MKTLVTKEYSVGYITRYLNENDILIKNKKYGIGILFLKYY